MSTTSPTQLEPTATSVETQRRPAVLVVVDPQAKLTALDALFSALDVEVVRAASSADALEQMLVRDFAAVVLDGQLPQVDGFVAAVRLRQGDGGRHPPIVSLADVIGRQAEALRSKEQEAEREHAAREAAEAENRTKDEFLAILSHELRAPLNAILGWASLLETEPNLSPRATKGLDAIARNARAQSRLVDDLIDVSQLVAHTLTIDSLPTDLAVVTRAAMATLEPAAGDRRIRLELDVAPADYALLGDPRRLEQLVCSLLSNAIKFSPPDAVVAIELFRSGAGLQLRVKDAGIGIPAELLPHIFEAFRQNDSSWTRRRGGLGIGLTMARHLAELHGGTVEAFSAGERRGAMFVLTVPAAGQAKLASAADAAATAPAGARAEPDGGALAPLDRLRVLVVDDDLDARELLEMLLTDAGAEVATAASARDAVQRFEAGRFDVLLSDLGMPDEDGLSLVRTIRRLDAARGGALVSVALSGYGSAEDRERSAQAGFDAHLTKPCERRTLIESLARLTRRDAGPRY